MDTALISKQPVPEELTKAQNQKKCILDDAYQRATAWLYKLREEWSRPAGGARIGSVKAESPQPSITEDWVKRQIITKLVNCGNDLVLVSRDDFPAIASELISIMGYQLAHRVFQITDSKDTSSMIPVYDFVQIASGRLMVKYGRGDIFSFEYKCENPLRRNDRQMRLRLLGEQEATQIVLSLIHI